MAVRPSPRSRPWIVAIVVAVGVAALVPGASGTPTRTATAAPPVTQSSVVKPIAADYMVGIGSTLYFRAQNSAYGAEIWKSNGTPGGTFPFKDVNPGWESSDPVDLTVVGSQLYFTAEVGDDCCFDRELWVSDGTGAGTHLTRNINQDLRGPCCWSSDPVELTAFNGMLFFSAEEHASTLLGDRELWRSDGTRAGTVRVRNLNNDDSSDPGDLTAAGGWLYFAATSHGGRLLWKSDGSLVGTVPVKGRANLQPQFITAVGDRIFFVSDYKGGRELWTSDGTAAGTHLVRDLNQVSPGGSDPQELAAVGNNLFFSAADANGDRELWKSDGTWAGTVKVKNINTFASNDPFQTSSDPKELTDVNGTLFFAAIKDFDLELWKSDGTRTGTVRVKDINPLGASFPSELTAVGSRLLFRAQINGTDDQLWMSDGTRFGTVPVGPAGPTINLGPRLLTNVQGTLYYDDWTFNADVRRFDRTLWKTTIGP